MDEDDEDGEEEEEDSDGSYEDDEEDEEGDEDDEDEDEVEGKGDQQTKKVFRFKIHHLLSYSFNKFDFELVCVVCCDVSGSCSYVCCNG